jgi:serine/threonine protein kinase
MTEMQSSSSTKRSLVGKHLGKWVLEKQIGEGGMSVVYLGRDRFLGKKAAIKILRPEMYQNQDAMERFRREALSTNELNHPNIIQVYELNEDREHGYYMALEYLEGQDLSELAPQYPLPVGWMTPIIRQVCSALTATHKAGIVHRDLKPSNIFLLPEKPHPCVKLLDFGIAKQQKTDHSLTRTGMILGTPAYLAPEQMLGQKDYSQGASVDIYAVGVILYQLLTGKLPLEKENLLEFLFTIANDTPLKLGEHRPELKGTLLEKLVERMLAKNPSARPQSMEEVWHTFEEGAKAFADPLNQLKPAPVLQKQRVASEEDAFNAPPSNLPTGLALDEEVLEESTIQVKLQQDADASATRNLQSPKGASTKPLTKQAPSRDVSQDKQPFASDATILSAYPRASKRPLMIGLLLLLFLVGGVGLGAWFMTREPATPQKPPERRILAQRIQPPPAPRTSLLDQLIAEGTDAFKKNDYQKAATLWKKAVALPDAEKQKQKSKLFRGIGVALARQQQAYAATIYYKRYLASASPEEKNDPNEAQELQRVKEEVLPQMEAEIQKGLEGSKRYLQALQRLSKSKRWDKLHEAYTALLQHNAHLPKPLLDAASLLAATLPDQALALYKKILDTMELQPEEATEAKKKYEALREERKRQQDKADDELQKAHELNKQGKSRQARLLVERSLNQDPLLLLAMSSLMRLTQAILEKDQAEGKKLLEKILQTRQMLSKRGLDAWKEQSSGLYPESDALKERLALLEELRKLWQMQMNLRALVRKARFPAVRELFDRFVPLWKNANERDKAGDLSILFARLASYRIMPPFFSGMLREQLLLEKSFQSGSFVTASQYIAKLLGQLKAERVFLETFLEPRTVQAWRESVEAMREKHQRAQQYLAEGESLMSAQDWNGAEKQFEAFKRILPRYLKIAHIEKMIRTCQCARGVTWVFCDDIRQKK